MSIQLTRFYPSPDLAPYIRFMYVIKSPEGTGDPLHRNHPQGAFDLLFNPSGGVRFGTPAQEEQVLSGIFSVGQQENYFDIGYLPGSVQVGAALQPHTYRHLLSLPALELANRGTALDDILPDAYSTCLLRLQTASDDAGRIALLESLFRSEFHRLNVTTSRFDQFLNAMKEQSGLNSVNQLASEANMSMRSLQRKVKEALGISPKAFSKVLRFNYALHLLKSRPEYDWQDILYQCGFFDQAHFIKDFNRFTGQTPASFLRSNRELSDFFHEA